MDEDGYIKIVTAQKTLVKSGGEWISSVDLENALMGIRGERTPACRHPDGEMAGAPLPRSS